VPDASKVSSVTRPTPFSASLFAPEALDRLLQRWNRRWISIGAGAAIVVFTLLAYLPALNGGFVWDDDSWTLRLAALLRDSSGLRTIWLRPTAMQQYYPLTGTTFWLDYQLWQFSPRPYHVENVLLHASAALLFWRILRRLEVRGAWLASSLFALHPVMVESAAWITERKNVLSLALCLGAYLAYLRFAADEPSDPSERRVVGPTRRRFLWYVLAWLLFVLALPAKTTVCSLPAAILLLTWWRQGRLRWGRDVLPTLPFFPPAAAMCAVTGWVEKYHAGAQGPDYALTLAQRCLIAGKAFWFYLGKLLWPANLCFVYPRWKPNPEDWVQWIYPLTALGFLLALWLARGKIGRGPAAALFFFAGTLAPLLGFVNLYFMRYSFVCDHWVYLPSLGPIALAAAALTSAVTQYSERPRLVQFAVGGSLLLVLGTLTWRQAGTYSDLESLWRVTINRNPDCWIGHSNLGNALFRRGRTAEAVAHFEQAIRLKPDLAEAYTSLGGALGSMGRLDDAIGKLTEAIRLNPTYAEAHYNLAIALERKGKLDGAIEQLEETIRLKPAFGPAHARLAFIRRQKARLSPER